TIADCLVNQTGNRAVTNRAHRQLTRHNPASRAETRSATTFYLNAPATIDVPPERRYHPRFERISIT
ncbi:MAG: hypothetical protein WKF63_11575, partial [Thermomicrobiales bacterium]